MWAFVPLSTIESRTDRAEALRVRNIHVIWLLQRLIDSHTSITLNTKKKSLLNVRVIQMLNRKHSFNATKRNHFSIFINSP